MERKIKGTSAAAFRFLFCAVFVVLVSGTAFAQVPALTLNPSSDLRVEMAYSHNTLIGYNLFVRKKPGMESVMLTESTGNYALRSAAWNPTNGNERRELSGKPLNDPNSHYSILSSTPIRDEKFGHAFQLFIPVNIVYGNPSSTYGTLNLLSGIRVNIRTFDHKYADPNRGKFQNNLVAISSMPENIHQARYEPPKPSYNHPPTYSHPQSYNSYSPHSPYTSYDPNPPHSPPKPPQNPPNPPQNPNPPNNADNLRRELREKIVSDNFMKGVDDDLKDFLIYLFWEMDREPGM